MKRYLFLLLIVFSSSCLLAQTDNTGQAPPTYQNPYGTNPYGTNPYGGSNGKNIFENNQNNTDNSNGNQNGNSNQNNTNTNPNNSNDNLTPEQKELVEKLNLKDNNKNTKDLQDKELLELYKNDPDYQKYVEQNGEDGLEEILKKNQIGTDPEDLEKSMIYGANFFNNNVFNLSSQNLTSVPNDYKLGRGDQLVVSVWGSAQMQNTYTIFKDGSISPNLVGKIYLQGLSYEAAESIIKARFRKILPPGSNIDVIIGSVRQIRVNIVGEVKRPGTFTISAFNTPLNALSLAGGLTEKGNMRDIRLIRNGTVIEHLDLYQYLQTGSFGRSVYLEDNDFVSIELYDKVVEATGAFKRPMFYQLTEYETLNDLIKLAGGPTFNARQSLIRVKTIQDEQEVFQDFQGSEYFSSNNSFEFVLKDGDVVRINSINEGLTNILNISGAVNYPDTYQIKEGERLFDLIQRAGGLKSNAYKSRAYIFRDGNTSDASQAIKIDLSNMNDYMSENNVVINPGDAVQILSTNKFDETFQVEVLGLVRNPGKMPFRSGMMLKDVLLLSGGLKLDAESGRIEISNITESVDRYSIEGSKPNVKIVSINPDLSLDEISEQLVIKPKDRIFVRKKSELVSQESISILGEVDYPGPYALLSKNDRLTSMIKRSGGLTRFAFPEGAKLIRKNVGSVVIDLNEAMKRSGGKFDLILENGDQLIIPTKSDIVAVRGEVQSPINIKFERENNNVISYIDAAGGFGEKPWRKRVTVTYQNGRSKRTKNFLFLHFYPNVRAGSVINVPQRPEREPFDLGQAVQYGLTTATSVLTILLLTDRLNQP